MSSRFLITQVLERTDRAGWLWFTLTPLCWQARVGDVLRVADYRQVASRVALFCEANFSQRQEIDFKLSL